MENIIIVVVLLAVLGLAAWYVVRAKRSGQKCIGCPHARECAKKCACGTDGK